jgi:hypothetical protein
VTASRASTPAARSRATRSPLVKSPGHPTSPGPRPTKSPPP